MKIGILGAGQLSRMMALSGIPMGFEFEFYSSSLEHCVSSLGNITFGEYDDWEKLQSFASQCDFITFENENIPLATLRFLEMTSVVHPKSDALYHTQDRLVEKKLFQKLDIPTVPFKAIDNKDELISFIKEYDFPVLLKSRRDGYDGKGQCKIKSSVDLDTVELRQDSLCIVEKMITFDREISIIGVRSEAGQIAYYDICQNHHVNGILQFTRNRRTDPMLSLASHYLQRLMEALNYIGVMTLELFETQHGLLANEYAPRVHNTGHWTIEGSVTSQFANHIRAIVGVPLGSTESYGLFEMTNMLGILKPREEALKHPSCYFHDYKKKSQPGRKIGHINKFLGNHRPNL